MKKFYTVLDVNAHIRNLSAETALSADGVDLLISFDNLYDGVITAVKLTASGYNSFGDLIPVNGQERFFIVIQDLHIDRGAAVRGLRYRIPNTEIRRVETEEYQICYEDGRIVTYPGREELAIDTAEYEEYSDDAETLAAMRTFVTPSFRYFPQEYDSGWFCTCGYFNRCDAGHCLCCGSDRDAVLSVRDQDNFVAVLDRYHQAREEQAQQLRLAQEEQARQMQQTQEQAAAYAAEKAAEKEAAKARRRENRPRRRMLAVLAICFILAVASMWIGSIERTEVTYHFRSRTETVTTIDGKTLYETEYRDGRLARETQFDANERMISECYYDYFDEPYYSEIFDGAAEINVPYQIYRTEITYSYDSSDRIEKAQYLYYHSDGVLPDPGTGVYEYDDDGNISKISYYDELGVLSGYRLYEYDDRGNKTKETYFDEDGKEDYRYEYEYDERDNRTKNTYFDEKEEWWSCSVCEYDDNDVLVKQTFYHKDDEVSDYYIYDNDDQGNAIKISRYDSDGSLAYYYCYQYDDAGWVMNEKDYLADGTPSYSFDFDEYGKLLKSVSYDSDGKQMESILFDYNADGNVVSYTVYDADDRLSSSTRYEYNEKGTMTKKTSHDADDEL